MQFKTAYTATTHPGKTFRQKSLTVPDQAMPISEILRRFAHGLPLSGQKVPMYDGGDPGPGDFERMELTDRMDAIEAAKQELKAIKEKARKKPEKAAEKAPEKEPEKKPEADKAPA